MLLCTGHLIESTIIHTVKKTSERNHISVCMIAIHNNVCCSIFLSSRTYRWENNIINMFTDDRFVLELHLPKDNNLNNYIYVANNEDFYNFRMSEIS